jgi:multiple sugar transport system permease protein
LVAPPVKRLNEGRVALFLVLPTLVILVGLAIFPLGWAGTLAFRVENLFRPDIGKWVGLRNFKYLLTEDTFWKSIRLTLIWCICVVSIQMTLGFVFAMMLDTRARIVGVLRTLIVIPVFISPIAMGLTWQFMFEPVSGIINYLLGLFGLPGGTWHTSTETALIAVMIADIWQWTPFVTLILLAGIQGISPEVVEAARLDRVKGWNYVVRVVLPLIWPVVMVVLLLRLVDSIRIFDLIYIITRGGPGTATLVASVYDFTIFQAGRIGVMAAYGFLILIVINVVVILFLRLLYKQEKEAKQIQKV